MPYFTLASAAVAWVLLTAAANSKFSTSLQLKLVFFARLEAMLFGVFSVASVTQCVVSLLPGHEGTLVEALLWLACAYCGGSSALGLWLGASMLRDRQ